MLPSTCPDSFASFLVGVSPAVSALVSAIALWVASKARSTYKEEQRILSDLVTNVQRSSKPPGPNVSPRRVRDRRKS